jgi:agmatinase
MAIQTLPWAELATTTQSKADMNIYGIPFDGAASVGKGTAEAPDRLRFLSKNLPGTTDEGVILSDNFFVYDAGDIELDLNWERFFGTLRKDAQKLMTDKFTLFLGGDHSVSIPLLEAFRETYRSKKIGVIHFDCHADLMDEYEGSKWSHACPLRRFLEMDGVNAKDLAQVGLRSYEAEEIHFINNNPIHVYHASKVERLGVQKVTEELIQLYKTYDAIFITTDIDVLDPAFAPGTGTPEGGGLATRQMMYMIKNLIQNLPVKAMDLVEISPPRDINDITSWAGLKIIYEIFAALYTKKNPDAIKLRDDCF